MSSPSLRGLISHSDSCIPFAITDCIVYARRQSCIHQVYYYSLISAHFINYSAQFFISNHEPACRPVCYISNQCYQNQRLNVTDSLSKSSPWRNNQLDIYTCRVLQTRDNNEIVDLISGPSEA